MTRICLEGHDPFDYEGPVDAQGLPCGEGKGVYYQDGKEHYRYEGSYKAGLRQGFGRLWEQKENRWKIAQTTAKERIQKLKKLRNAIVKRQDDFYKAIWQDFHKPQFEAWLSEIFPAIEEIDYTISHLKSWMKDKKVRRVFFLADNKE